MKALLFILGFAFGSFWLILLISISINVGLKIYFELRDEDKNESSKQVE